MKRWIRALALLLLLSFTVAALAGCKLSGKKPGPNNDPEQKTEDPKDEEKKNDPEPPALQTVKVTFKYENGKADFSVTLKENEVLTAPETPTYEGYLFLGWFADGADEPYDFTTDAIGKVDNFTLTAHWEEEKPLISWEDLIPKEKYLTASIVSAILSLGTKGDLGTEELAAAKAADDSTLTLGFDENGNFVASLDAGGSLKVFSFEPQGSVRAMLDGGKVYIETSDGETPERSSYDFEELASGIEDSGILELLIDYAEEALDGELPDLDEIEIDEDAVKELLSVLIPLLTEDETIDETYNGGYNVPNTDVDDGVYYLLDAGGRLRAIDAGFMNQSVEEFVDDLLGYGTYGMIDLLVGTLLDAKCNNVSGVLSTLNLSEEEFIGYYNKLAELLGKEDFDLGDYLNNRAYRNVYVLSFLFDDIDAYKSFKATTELFFERGCEESVYSLVAELLELDQSDLGTALRDAAMFFDNHIEYRVYVEDFESGVVTGRRLILDFSETGIAEEYVLDFSCDVMISGKKPETPAWQEGFIASFEE